MGGVDSGTQQYSSVVAVIFIFNLIVREIAFLIEQGWNWSSCTAESVLKFGTGTPLVCR